MAEDDENTNIDYRLKTIELQDFKLGNPPVSTEKITKFHFRVDVALKPEKEEKCIGIAIEVLISIPNQVETVGSIKVLNVFEIEDAEFVIVKTTEITKFSDNFYKKLIDISISNTRGIMYSQFRGTFLHKAILPLISGKTLRRVKSFA